MNTPLGDVTARFHCQSCDQDISLVVDDDDNASCSNCGQPFGPMEAIRALHRKEAAKLVEAAMRKTLGKALR